MIKSFLEKLSTIISIIAVISAAMFRGYKWYKKNKAARAADQQKNDEKLNIIIKQLFPNGGMSAMDQIMEIKKLMMRSVAAQESFFMLSEAPLFTNSETGSCNDVNEAACELYGASKNELLGFGWTNFILPNEREIVKREWTEAIQTDNEITKIYTIQNPVEDCQIKCKYTAVIVRDTHGKIIRIMGRIKELERYN